MKLYYAKGSCSLAVRIVIHELGLPCEFESVNLKTKVTEHGVNFLTINPKGSVPTLAVEDTKVLTENAVIQQYLADNFHGDQLLPPMPEWQRYLVLGWLNFVSTELHKSFGPLFNLQLPQAIKDEIFIPHLKAKLDYVEQHLQTHAFLAGDAFSLPDGYLFVILRWLANFGIPLTTWPTIARYYEIVKNRPAVQTALKEEGLLGA